MATRSPHPALPSALALALAALQAGCATVRSDFVAATGEPLGVHDREFVHVGTRTEQTSYSQTQHRGPRGRVVHTASTYETRPVVHAERHVYPLQGNVRIDDESFWRIVEDRDAVRRYDAYHASGKRMNTGALVVAAGALVAGVGGFVAYRAAVPEAERNSTVEIALVGGGAGVAVFSGLFALAGKYMAGDRRARLVDDPERMKMRANEYNRKRGFAVAPPPLPSPPPPPPSVAPVAPVAPVTPMSTSP